MYLIVGLGNPGEKYVSTRHNVGFMFVDYFIRRMEALHAVTLEHPVYQEKFKSVIGKYDLGEKYIVAKPQTFMNLSGEAVRRIVGFYKTPTNTLYVAHDDLDIPFGKYKVQHGVGPKLHNGIESIENRLAADDFHRIRIGVDGREGRQIPGETYVLQEFNQVEHDKLPDIFASILTHLPFLK